jgi:hypothetical protein
MRLTVLDQITITSIRAGMLRPGETLDLSDSEASGLLSRHPRVFRRETTAAAPAEVKPGPRRKTKAQVQTQGD